MSSLWLQRSLTIAAKKRGLHLITQEILSTINSDLAQFSCGLCHFFIQHTSASLTINENCDSDVRADMEQILNTIVPESSLYRHNDEGLDDLPAHMKSSLMGCELSVPITKGRLNLGTWQGIYLNEHRNHGGSRKIVVTMQGAASGNSSSSSSSGKSKKSSKSAVDDDEN